MKRFRVESRQKEIQKFSHALYRNQSKKIFEILRRYGGIVEKASCDEAFIDLTECINKRYEELVRTKADSIFGEVLENWKEAYMFGHKEQGEGLFKPENLWDQKLFLANKLAYQMRQDIKKELGYNASCGIGYNKTLAKIASAQNKPNAQTVVFNPVDNVQTRPEKTSRFQQILFLGKCQLAPIEAKSRSSGFDEHPNPLPCICTQAMFHRL